MFEWRKNGAKPIYSSMMKSLSDDSQIWLNDIFDGLNTLAIVNQTQVQTTLPQLGLAIAFNNAGETLYVIADYPDRPTHDFFNDAPLVKPIGYTYTDSKTHQGVYGLDTPRDIVLPTTDVPDILPQLRAMETYANAYIAEHNLQTTKKTVVPYLFIFSTDSQKINSCIQAGLHPKRVAELLALGFTLPDIIDSKDIPIRLLMAMGDGRKFE
jgi:hypothetical protein